MNVIIITPEDPEYNHRRLNWDTRFDFHPKKIIQVLNEEGVRETLKYIQEKKYHFAVRGGKHCFEPWSLTDGILLDLSKMDRIQLKDGVVRIGAGATLGKIYEYLLSQDRMIPAGTRPTVGIGGQGLNGGIGYSTRKYGLLTDSIVGYRVILADGKSLKVTRHDNSDLFWALRGSGAGNFCVVTDYYVRTYPVTKVTVFTYNYNYDNPGGRKALKWLTTLKAGSNDLTAQAVISKDGIKVTGQVFGRRVPKLPDPDTSEIKYTTFKEAIAYWSAPTVKESAKAKSRFGYDPLPEKAIDQLIESVRTITLDPHVRFTVGIQQLRGDGKGSIPWYDSKYWINWMLRWTEGPEPEAKCLEESYLKTLPYMDKYSYMGMMDLEVGLTPDDYRGAYYGDNYESLLKIKSKYDPTGLFKYCQGLLK